jgi:hypothetical protein
MLINTHLRKNEHKKRQLLPDCGKITVNKNNLNNKYNLYYILYIKLKHMSIINDHKKRRLQRSPLFYN